MTTETNRLVGKIDAILTEWQGGATPSLIARKAKCDYAAAKQALDLLVRTGFAVTDGNGAWTRYYAK